MDTVKLANGLTIPFPVATPFAMRPNLRRLEKDEPVVTRDFLFQEYLREKQGGYAPVFGDSPDLLCLKRAIATLQDVDPTFTLSVHQEDLVYALTMSLQEDWVLLSPNAQGKLSAQILSVHFPSGWNPREKAGMTFSELHEPVADNALIMRAADQIAATIATKGPFVRHVWSLSNTGALNLRPDLAPKTESDDIEQMWFRCERQTTLPVDGGAALFLIRVYVAPMKQVFQNPEHKILLIESILSMTDAVARYKGLGRLRERLGAG
jgi:hypothetical protein